MTIKVAIVEDHQGIIDGYLYRLTPHPEIQIVGVAYYGIELGPMLASQEVDVLLLDVNLHTSPEDRTPFKTLAAIPGLLKEHPDLSILAISMSTQIALIQALVDAGVRGYIFKDDQNSIQKLATIVEIVAKGGMYFSPEADRLLHKKDATSVPQLTPRQLEILTLCANYPDWTTAQIAFKLGISSSTVRNLLTKAYVQLGVHTRVAALTRLRQMGLIAEASLESGDINPKP